MKTQRRYFAVSVFPLYPDGRTGDLCAYESHEDLEVAMGAASRAAEQWLRAPADSELGDGGADAQNPAGFDITVEIDVE